MAKLPRRTPRDLRIAARDGDLAACKALLRFHGKDDLAAAIRKGQGRRVFRHNGFGRRICNLGRCSIRIDKGFDILFV